MRRSAVDSHHLPIHPRSAVALVLHRDSEMRYRPELAILLTLTGHLFATRRSTYLFAYCVFGHHRPTGTKTMMMKTSNLPAALMIAALLLVFACGQKGPLYLPEDRPGAAPAGDAAPQEADGEEEASGASTD